MAANEPIAELDKDFSSDKASVTAWSDGRRRLEEAEVYWLSTVRPDGRPHVTPLISVWMDDALYFCTGPGERKAKNLEHNARCILTTGSNALNEGLDLVVEGDAVQVADEAKLRRVADQYRAKYGKEWDFDVENGAFAHDGHTAIVFEVAPQQAFGFGKGEHGQTRWRFEPAPGR